MSVRRPSRLRTLASTVVLATTLGLVATTGATTATAPVVDRPPLPAADYDVVRVNYAAVMAVNSTTTVAAGAKIVAKGTVKVRRGAAAQPRPVLLLEKQGARWVKRAAKKTTRRGDFTFSVKAGAKARTRIFEVRAPRAHGLAATKSRFRVQVIRATPMDPPTEPTPTATKPAGDPGDWRYLYDGGARWNPCQTIEWGMKTDGAAYPGAVRDMTEAFARISTHTGLKFSYAGDTGRDFNISWATEATDPQLKGSVVGYAGSAPKYLSSPADVQWGLHNGKAVLDSDANLRPGFDVSGNPTWGQVMTHELLHAMGLHHATGNQQIMYGTVSSMNHRFGAGDLTGMKKVGASGGCLS